MADVHDDLPRCEWAGEGLMQQYHDLEWGVPVHDEHMLFEFLILEGAQAGLSWSTILNKRENYRAAFDGFDPAVVAGYGPDRVEMLLQNAAIVRNRAKVTAAVQNAQTFLKIQDEFGSFDAYIWRFVGGTPCQNNFPRLADLPAQTGESARMSKDLLSRGFRFVGPTICYAFMQAVGMVNDHTVTCFRHAQLGGKG
jgi:DNA-3-methyladenine glycosylase I